MNHPQETLFTAHPATGLDTLIQYNQFQMNSHVVRIGYADAARRLRASYRAQSWDDVMLLPFLFVWRQAIEIVLKDNIRDLAELRRQGGDTDYSLGRDAVDKRLRHKIGHKLGLLIEEHQAHCAGLALGALPDPILSTLQLLAALDDGGTGFRYAGALPAPSADIDFETIAEALDDAYLLLEVVIDAATNGEGVSWR